MTHSHLMNTVNGRTSTGKRSPEGDRRTLIEQFNATDDGTTLRFCLPQIFERAAERHSDNIAVICGKTELTYKALDSLSNHLTRILVEERGIRRGHVVGIVLDRSINLIISLLAVLKAGAVYMPIDPSIPIERVKQMMDDASPRLVVTDGVTQAHLSLWKDMNLNIDAVRSESSSLDANKVATVDLRPQDLAYMIYTSGSTGRPKGARANHEALCNLLLAMRRTPGCNWTDRLLAVASVSFDISIADLLLPLISGGTLVIAQSHQLRDPDALIKSMQRHSITIMQATPSFWQMLLDSNWRMDHRLARIVTAGEPLSRRLADRLLARADEVWNAYGPSEATIYASMGRVRQDDQDIDIGTPVPNFQLYVLDAENLSNVPLGSTGELCITGIGVKCGYHNSPELTKLRFLENPFHHGRLYRTGDLARFTAPGRLRLKGRTDSQVKVRGYRIELGDVETALTAHKDVSAAVVLNRDDRLIAYCLCNTIESIDKTNVNWSLDEILRPWLVDRLPAYMMPTFFVKVEALPMTVNGKIDQKALPDLMVAAEVGTVKGKPQTELERSILSIWTIVLGHDCIGTNDNFFQIGGNSLRVPRVKTELEKLMGQPVQAAKLFEHYTVRTLAQYLERVGNDSQKDVNNTQPFFESPRQVKYTPITSIHEDIAIVSMACRLPGSIKTPEEYWEMLAKGHHGITDVPIDRWNSDALFDADPDAPGKSYCRRGGFIAGGIDSFDAAFFGISPREARALDPTQHIMLEVCWEGFESAGYTMQQLRGSQTGVFIGQSNIAAHNSIPDFADLDGYAMTGSSSATLSGRVSYTLGLEGPSMTVDTACSSSLVSTHLACTALRQGECDMAVAGGITILSPGLFVEFSKLRGLSPDGHCRAFSADTQGTGLSEGSTAVVLKRLSDAQRDGDIIHAILRGTAVNHGGSRAAGLTIPSSSAQERLIRTALHTSGLSPSDIDYVEAHGTATKLGDPIEGTAITEVFSSRFCTDRPLWIGSSKSNLGHTQAAAGLAGVIKVALALQHNMLPKTLNITEPTPLIDWEKANMALVLKHQPWTSVNNTQRRAGVSSFGIGGTYAHLIIEEAPTVVSVAEQSAMNHVQSPPMLPFLVSAQSHIALRHQIRKLHRHIKVHTSHKEGDSLGNLACSLATTRTHFRRRVALFADSKKDLLQKLVACSEARPNELPPLAGVICNHNNSCNEDTHLAILFTGQGSQRLGMGKGLSERYPLFCEALEDITARFTDLEMPLLDVMWADLQSETALLLDRTDFAQPAIFSLEVALWRLWESWGVKPETVLGHSVGEIAAAHVAGVLDLSSACRLVAARGRLMQDLASGRSGSMASLNTDAAEVTEAISALDLDGRVEIAVYNSPTQTVISGDDDAVKLMMAHTTRKLACKVTELNVSHAFHSHHMDRMLLAFQTVAETIQFSPPKLLMISSLTGRLAEAGQLEQPDYWVQQVRRAVRFSDSVQTLHRQGVNICLELGPQSVLCGMAASSLTSDHEFRNDMPAFLPSLMTGKKEDQRVVMNTLAELHVRHIPIDWHAYFKPFNYQRVQLPTYAFQRQRYKQIRPFGMLDSSLQKRASKTNPDDEEDGRDCLGIDRFEFEVKWSADHGTKDISSGISKSWGYLCPDRDTIWIQEAKKALSRAGIQLKQAQQLEDAANLDGLLCFWDSPSDVEIPPGALDLTIRAVNQLQTAATMGFVPPLVWITRKAVGVQIRNGDNNILSQSFHNDSGDWSHREEQSLAAAPLWGLVRTARYEHPELKLRLVDLDLDKDTFDTLASVITVSSDEPDCAIRKGQVFRPRIQKVLTSKGIAKQQPFSPRKKGAILITGGLGGIGQQMAKWLASTYCTSDLVLTSRRGMKTPNAEALIGELAQLNAKATIIACDVGDFESIKSLTETFNEERPLRGVIHAAGLVDNGILSTLTPQQFASTFRPKVDGAWYLHKFTQDMNLDFFMMFSSVSGVLGLPGLANYASANAFVDALAHIRQAQGLPATSIAYGVWDGEGMAANLNDRTTRSHLARMGLDPLKPEDGLELFAKAVSSGRAITVAAALDLKRLRGQLIEERGNIPSLFRLLLDQKADDEKTNSEMRIDNETRQLREILSEAPLKQHASILLALVRETVGKTLGFTSAEEVDTDVPLQNIGFDSLTAVLIRNQLAKLTGLKTLSTSSITWNHPNLKSLSQHLLSQLQRDAEERSTTSDAVVEKAPNGTNPANRASSGPDISMVKKGYLDASLTFDSIGSLQRPNSVFITGATGFVGSFILHELLDSGISAHCLVRAKGDEIGMQRLITVLASYDLWKPDYASLLQPVIGDLAKPFFGLDEEVFDRLADQVDTVCHAGALVDWMRPLEEYIGPNVVSTHEILRLAARGRCKAIHIISTLATLPKHLGYEVSEHDREYGYSTSKYMAERMVSAARWRGAKASVYRVPFVTASASSGHFRHDRGDFLHNLIAGSIELGSFPALDADLSVVLPVDYLSKTIVSVMVDDLSRIGHDYDFVRAPAPTSDRFFELMGAAVAAEGGGSGRYDIQTFTKWQQRALIYAAAHPKSPLAHIAAVIDGLTEQSAPDLLRGCPPGQHVFGGDIYPAPEIDEQVLQSYWSRIKDTRPGA
ncbi:putative PKS/NRPS-like protein biosynthetic cluster [Bacidia gigantensis]|uniref:putative PKS/NRPS-like protein biosynthetic cluster n=1 Tax=Bacidia gigantensis TaxID=2732470 RepID=UPI001D056803|nr:putative PKS/NRPS-like protein biosynthetic cluster [Bacidia gigantensis]KAG8534309.1 putative PKS/NRPS-like protein biosynthetic cluster [Bacidia gigantensis]